MFLSVVFGTDVFAQTITTASRQTIVDACSVQFGVTGKYITKLFTKSGTFTCSLSAFDNKDPAVGVSTKECLVGKAAVKYAYNNSFTLPVVCSALPLASSCSIQYGAGSIFDKKVFSTTGQAVTCGLGAFDRDPAPSVKKTCIIGLGAGDKVMEGEVFALPTKCLTASAVPVLTASSTPAALAAPKITTCPSGQYLPRVAGGVTATCQPLPTILPKIKLVRFIPLPGNAGKFEEMTSISVGESFFPSITFNISDYDYNSGGPQVYYQCTGMKEPRQAGYINHSNEAGTSVLPEFKEISCWLTSIKALDFSSTVSIPADSASKKVLVSAIATAPVATASATPALVATVAGKDCSYDFYVVQGTPENAGTKSPFVKGKKRPTTEHITWKDGQSLEVYPTASEFPIYIYGSLINSGTFACQNGNIVSTNVNSSVVFINYDHTEPHQFQKSTCGFTLPNPNICAATTTTHQVTTNFCPYGQRCDVNWNHQDTVVQATAAAGIGERYVHELKCSPQLSTFQQASLCPVLNKTGRTDW